MLYIDQPAGVGFSYQSDQTNSSVTCDDEGYCQPSGIINATAEVNSTVAAAPFVWKFVQAFFAQFPQYENRDFGIFTESYGGHYGPGTSFVPHFNLDPTNSRIRTLFRTAERRNCTWHSCWSKGQLGGPGNQ